MLLARAAVAAPSSRFLAGGAPASGLPSHDTAAPQAAIPQEGSAWTAASNPLVACENQNECSSATARVNTFWAAGVHDVGKFTVPSFSTDCWAPTGVARSRPIIMTIAATRMLEFSFPLAAGLAVPPHRAQDMPTRNLRHLLMFPPWPPMALGRAKCPRSGVPPCLVLSVGNR